MNSNSDNLEAGINRWLDAEMDEAAEHELNRSLIRDQEMMRLRQDYEKIDSLASEVLAGIRTGAEVDLGAVFAAAPSKMPLHRRAHRGWLMIPGAIAAALLAIVIPDPEFQVQRGPASVVERPWYGSAPGSSWSPAQLERPVSHVPKIRSQTGTDVIGVVGEDGNLYWIEVERKQTIRWPAGPPSPADSM